MWPSVLTAVLQVAQCMCTWHSFIYTECCVCICVSAVSLQDINMRKPFKSSVIQDQQIATLESRPKAIVERYDQCDAPPPLDKLNPYRQV